METYVGTICAFGFNYAPYGWALCNGQVLQVNQYAALFALLGAQYGGDGRTTFGLPDLQGRAAIGYGQGAGLAPYDMGEKAGAETVTFNVMNFPPHNHQVTLSLNSNNSGTSTNNPSGTFPGFTNNDNFNIYSDTATSSFMGNNTTTISNAGAGSLTPVDIHKPYLTMNYCIALYGDFPQRP